MLSVGVLSGSSHCDSLSISAYSLWLGPPYSDDPSIESEVVDDSTEVSLDESTYES